MTNFFLKLGLQGLSFGGGLQWWRRTVQWVVRVGSSRKLNSPKTIRVHLISSMGVKGCSLFCLVGSGEEE